MPPHSVLDDQQMAQIFAYAEQILAKVGIALPQSHPSRARLKGHGLTIKDDRLFCDPGAVFEHLSQVPKRFEIAARNAQKSVIIGQDFAAFAAGQGALMVRDRDNVRRPANRKDLIEFIKLAHTTPALQLSSPIFSNLSDIKPGLCALEQAYDLLCYSDQAFISPAQRADHITPILHLAKIAFGGALPDQPVMLGSINWNRPLTFDAPMLDMMEMYLGADQAIVLSPVMVLGATAPASLEMALAQWLAEILAALALSQIIRCGAPVIVGAQFATLAMKYGTPKLSGPEMSFLGMAAQQIARKLAVPSRLGAGFTSSKQLDAQAGAQTMAHLHDGLSSGAHLVLNAAGLLEAGQVVSYAKFLCDVSILEEQQSAMASHHGSLDPDDPPNVEAISSLFGAISGQSFMGHPHTLQTATRLSEKTGIYNDDLYELWQACGEETVSERAIMMANARLDDYQKPDLDHTAERAMRAYIDDKAPCFDGQREQRFAHMETHIQADMASLLHDNIWDGVFHKR